ncbi:MAG: polynucleotide kinase-phosphatase [Fimbriiglobus sp.]
MLLRIPDFSLVVLIGASGSGKSTFARKHFLPTEIISSDYCRGLVSDNENDQAATPAAFELLNFIAAKRLQTRRLTVIDATNVQPEARAQILTLSKKYHVLPVAIVFNLPEKICHERNANRPDRNFGPHVVRNHYRDLKRSLGQLDREGFRYVYHLRTLEEVEACTIQRDPLWTDRRQERGPFDIIGDLHGCADELETLLAKLGYVPEKLPQTHEFWGEQTYRHPEGRRAIFVGDLVDRGPRSLDCVRVVRNMIEAGSAMCVPGNHDVKLVKKLRGKDIKAKHGLELTMNEFANLPEELRPKAERAVADFLDRLVSHLVLEDGKLVVAHAGLKEEYQNRSSGTVRSFCYFGETTGEIDEFGLPVRANWAADYRGKATVVYGHTPTLTPEWLNNTICIDTGCVFGGTMTALRYPERELVSIPAAREYYTPARPLVKPTYLNAQQSSDTILHAEDVLGKRLIQTRLRSSIMIQPEKATAALEAMSRFAVDPRWLVYLPPTMSPSETSQEEGFLEHPQQALDYYRNEGVTRLMVQEKHMGSRAVVIVCQSAAVTRERFGIDSDEIGIIYTRSGRRFFNDLSLEQEFLTRLQTALTKANFWEEHSTTWVALDCELMPWSAKAVSLLQTQYAATGAAGVAGLSATTLRFEQAKSRLSGEERQLAETMQTNFESRETNIRRFVESYRRYCRPVARIEDYKLAPFHILATESVVGMNQPHSWHLEKLDKIGKTDLEILQETRKIYVDIGNSNHESETIRWWLDLTESGGEGAVFKPWDYITTGIRGIVQPAIKCRGREYLRIIYGPEYTTPENLARLRKRGLHRKRMLANLEFALGFEALERFTRREPLRRVHECIFGILALESEPVDPRL